MTGLGDLLQSERGFFCLAVLFAITVLAVLHIVTGDQWIDFAKYLVVTLVASKTITTAAETYVTKKPQIPSAEVVS